MANVKTKLLKEYGSLDMDCPSVARYSRNLNALYVEGRLDPCYHREVPITQIQKILLRKSKANVLLTGPAGCGKTAIAEGLAAAITERRIAYEVEAYKTRRAYNQAVKKWEKEGSDQPRPEYVPPVRSPLCDWVIYELSLNAMVSGTRYRGDFEQRLQDMLQECKKAPNIILFIDEFHSICRTGAAEGCESAAQILKPALARNDIRVIGATTTEEKAAVLQDKAFARRFSELTVMPLDGDTAMDTARNILANYCSFHGVSTKLSAENLLALVQYFLPHTVFPDNFINVVDETLAGAVFDGLTAVDVTHFSQVLSRMTGQVILCANEESLSGSAA